MIQNHIVPLVGADLVNYMHITFLRNKNVKEDAPQERVEIEEQ